MADVGDITAVTFAVTLAAADAEPVALLLGVAVLEGDRVALGESDDV